VMYFSPPPPIPNPTATYSTSSINYNITNLPNNCNLYVYNTNNSWTQIATMYNYTGLEINQLKTSKFAFKNKNQISIMSEITVNDYTLTSTPSYKMSSVYGINNLFIVLLNEDTPFRLDIWDTNTNLWYNSIDIPLHSGSPNYSDSNHYLIEVFNNVYYKYLGDFRIGVTNIFYNKSDFGVSSVAAYLISTNKTNIKINHIYSLNGNNIPSTMYDTGGIILRS